MAGGAGKQWARIIHQLRPAERIWDDITSYASRAETCEKMIHKLVGGRWKHARLIHKSGFGWGHRRVAGGNMRENDT